MAAVGSVQNDNTVKNTSIAGGVGAVAGGAGGYFLTNALKNGNATDKFVKAVATAGADTEVGKAVAQKLEEGFTEYITALKTTTEEGLNTAKSAMADKLRGFGIVRENLTAELENIKDVKGLKAFAENLSNAETTRAAKEVIGRFVENGKIVVKDTADDAAKKVGAGIQSAAKKMKLKAAGIYAAAGLAVLGTLAYVM